MSERAGLAARFAALGGLATGLAIAPAIAGGSPSLRLALALGAGSLALARRLPGAACVPMLGAVALLVGTAAGVERIEAIDSRALLPGEEVQLRARGVVATTPRSAAGTTRFTLDVAGRRLAVEHPGPVSGLDEGRVVAVAGTVREPAPWEVGTLARTGAARVLTAQRVRPSDAVRGGLRGALDGVRRRAEDALGRGTPAGSAALLRGFVLGQDDRIPEPVREEFRRSGLAHILAVSGQNVMLLILLAAPLLALTGAPLRVRLVLLAAVVAIYVPVAGAGPSIQRAGVMGVAGLVAALASRPRARWYALLLAAAVTLALDPRATGEVGWQLSFAAVAGLLVLAAPLARVVAGNQPGPLRRTLAEGGAMTVAATLATGPLVAHHFGVVSLTAVPANLVALPAVAPAMWLGMLAGALGQVPAAPVEPLTALGGLCAAFIGWTARAFGGASAQVALAEPSLPLAVALAAGLLLAGRLACLALARRRELRPIAGSRLPGVALGFALAGALAIAVLLAGTGGGSSGVIANPRLVIRVLDVGQGDAILIEPRRGNAILVDTGPPGDGVADRLEELGVERLAGIAITHDHLDHSGALGSVLARIEVGALLTAPGDAPEACARRACPPVRMVASGDRIRLGEARVDVLWPPGAGSSGSPGAGEDPNARSLVFRIGLGDFDALLTGDAEAELAPVDPGGVDALKVAHHGSADAGLEALLAQSRPALAVISVGPNEHGHPAGETLEALEDAGVEIRRTDLDGEVVIEVGRHRWGVG